MSLTARILRTSAALSLAVFCAANASAARADPPQQFALLIGNSDYDNDVKIESDPQLASELMPDLVHPCRDVHTVAAALDKYDFKRVDLYCDLHRDEMTKRFGDFEAKLANLPPKSIVLVYYSGHGLQFDGEIYGVPILFKPRPGQRLKGFDERRRFLIDNANLWQSLLQALPTRSDISVLVVIDACRNSPFAEASSYNESSVPETGQNQFVYWATNGGNAADDASLMSRALAAQIGKGGTLGDIASGIWRADHKLFQSHVKAYEGEPFTGSEFKFQEQAVLRLKPAVSPPAVVPASPPPEPIGVALKIPTVLPTDAHGNPKAPTLKTVFVSNRGLTLDVFVCEGEHARQNLNFAADMADGLKQEAAALDIGIIRVRYLPDLINKQIGYRVRTNLMRYDVVLPKYSNELNAVLAPEKPALFAVADRFPAAKFLPQPGIGVGGQPTRHYISAFLCSELGAR